ncbi:MAG TPA: HU family DNA-binding protein [bacterium]|nr:HU family DNA-binding protein [bacterium]
MNKTDLIQEVSRVTCAYIEARDAVAQIISSMRESLKRGEKISLQGFGTFSVKHKKPYIARNPKTGEKLNKAGRKVVKFKPSPDILS